MCHRIPTGFRARDCVLPRCAFVEEGREREAVLVEGGWQDDIMGLLDQGTNIVEGGEPLGDSSKRVWSVISNCAVRGSKRPFAVTRANRRLRALSLLRWCQVKGSGSPMSVITRPSGNRQCRSAYS